MKQYKITFEKRETDDVLINEKSLDQAFDLADSLIKWNSVEALPESMRNLNRSPKPCFLKPTIVALIDEDGNTVAEDEVVGYDKSTGMPILWLDDFKSSDDGQLELISRREIFR